MFLNENTLFITGLNGKKEDLKQIYLDFPILGKFMDDEYNFTSWSYDQDIDSFISIHGELINIDFFREQIAKHNKLFVKKPVGNRFQLKKSHLIKKFAYNTPSVSNNHVTPLLNRPFAVTKFRNVINFYHNWRISSSMLCSEARKLIPALKYINPKYSYNLSSKDAYKFWLLRQINFELAPLWNNLFKNNVYLIDYTLDHVMFREIVEDSLYVFLNLILAKSIIDYINNNIYLENISSEEFFPKMEVIIKNHYEEYNEAYILLQEVREFYINNYVSTKTLKEVSIKK